MHHKLQILHHEYEGRLAKKLGLLSYDRTLAIDLMKCMYEDDADFTNTFRALSSVSSKEPEGGEQELPEGIQAAIGKELAPERMAAWTAWLSAYRARCGRVGHGGVEVWVCARRGLSREGAGT